jgi:tRNA pseudouridine55 synthase
MDFVQGEVLLVDKPLEWTSFDVVNKIRYALKRKFGRLKVGHAGTLDPLATGLLLICTGKMTKQIDTYQAQQKTYTGSLLLGATTPTLDIEMPIDATYPTDHITPEMVHDTMARFIGAIAQIPPAYSAVKVNGQAAYAAARKGNELVLAARPVTIYELAATAIELPTVHFRTVCSKGTYIRSLARDIGIAMDSGAYLTSLRRTHIGDYSVADAWQLPDLIQHIDGL